MTTTESIAWFKSTFGERIARAVEGTPFSVDLVAAIANQETGYIWGPLVGKGFAVDDVLRYCVGDTLDQDRGRSCFPRNKAELLAAPRGAEMFAIARQALLDMASHVNGYQSATINPNKFCHGFGIFQYDIQFFRENPDYFLGKAWTDFDACLAQFIAELKGAAKRQGWSGRASLNDEEQVFVGIAYNKGTANRALGFKQGHRCDGRCYGENIYEFLRLAQGVLLKGKPNPRPSPLSQPTEAPERPAFKGLAPVYEVDVEEVPLRLRSEPRVSEPNPGANVIARLPRGQLVQRVSPENFGEFIEVETIVGGAELRGFASSKFLRRVERALPVKAPRKSARSQPGKTRLPRLTTQKHVAGERQRRKPVKGKQVAPAPEKQAAGGDPPDNMNIEEMVSAVQKALGVGVDGKAGPQTWAAIYTRIVGKKPALPATGTTPLPKTAAGAVDARSEKTIATLQPQVQPYARALVQKAAAQGITIKIISGLRTYAEQNDLYAQGRTKSGPKVTNARGGYSNHNFGIAFDIGVFDGAKYIPESARYKAIGALGVELGLEWGGNWKTIKDEPHFQLRPMWAANQSEGDMLAELRNRVDSGKEFYA